MDAMTLMASLTSPRNSGLDNRPLHLPPNAFSPRPLALHQHPNYLRCIERLGGMGFVQHLQDGSRTIGRAQIIRRRIGPLTFHWLPRGPVWNEGTTDAQKSAALLGLRAYRGPWLVLPEDAAQTSLFRATGHRALLTAQHVAEIELTQSEPARLRAQHGKWRNRLRHALAQALTVTDAPFRPDRDSALLQLEAVQRRARRYSALPPAFTLAYAAANPDTTRLFCASGPSGICAFILVLLHAPGATYHIGWSDTQGRTASAHNLLLWRAATWLAVRGFERFDLGTIDTEAAPGLARFKIGSGAQVRALGPLMLRLPYPRLGRNCRTI